MDIPLGYRAAANAVKLGRGAFFGSAIADLPKRPTEVLQGDDLVPQFGYVGENYREVKVLLLGINPGNGPKEATARSLTDERMMPTLAAFAANPTPSNFFLAQAAQKVECQTWHIWRRHCVEIFGAGRLSLEDIAYSNCLPWRTGSASNFCDSVAIAAARLYAGPLIEELRPVAVVALGKRVEQVLQLGGLAPKGLIVWNRAQAAIESVLKERQVAAELLFSQIGSRRSAGSNLTLQSTGRSAAATQFDVTQHDRPVQPNAAPNSREFNVSKEVVIPAARVQQGDLVLYTTSIKVRDLVSKGFYSVETLDPDNANDKGYQRLLNKARAKKLADYILKGQDSKDAFLPTSVFLATAKPIPFDAEHNTISFETESVGPFSVVDGQHRLEGLRMAAEKDERVLDFEVPVNIAVDLPKIAQMCHFLIVNTTQKSVDKSVEQRIIARLSDALDIEDDLPSLPKWIFNTVEKGEVERALKYVDFLNESEDSPWRGKIEMANALSDGSTVNQRSFVKAIVKYVLTANNPLATIVKDLDKERKIFLNYWKAVASILDDGKETVLYKYNGVELFCKFSIPFFIKLQDRGSFTTTTMESLLRSCFENVEGDYAGVGHPEWWAKGGRASFLNAGAINVVSQEMAKALHKTSLGGEIEL